MGATVSYRDIPDKERQRLCEAVCQRDKKAIFVVYFAAIFIPSLFSRNVARALLPKLSHLNLTVASGLVAALLAGVASLVVSFVVVRPAIRREVVKAKNSELSLS